MKLFSVLIVLSLALPACAGPSLDAGLLEAADNGDLKRAQTLVRQGAHVNARNSGGQTPLMLALQRYAKPLAYFLLKHGADVRARDKGGFSPLGYAAGQETELIEELVARGAKATSNDSGELSDWLQNDVWIDSGLEDEEVKAEANLFLRAGMNLNARGFDEWKTTPLLNAVISRPSLVGFLLDCGADPNVTDGDGTTPLMEASRPVVSMEGRDESTALLLLQRGARLNERDERGRTALMLAAQENRVAIVRELLQRRAQPNIRDEDGETALMRAATEGVVEIARLLLASGARPELQNVKGQTALDFARGRDFTTLNWFFGAVTRSRDDEQTQVEQERALKGRLEIQAILEGKAK